jgi:hypothetical protein
MNPNQKFRKSKYFTSLTTLPSLTNLTSFGTETGPHEPKPEIQKINIFDQPAQQNQPNQKFT